MKQWYTVPHSCNLSSTVFIPWGWKPCLFSAHHYHPQSNMLPVNHYILRKCIAALFSTLLPMLLQTQERIPQTKTQGIVCLNGIRAKMLFAIGSCWERKIRFFSSGGVTLDVPTYCTTGMDPHSRGVTQHPSFWNYS